jgi:hypothetical protein
MFPRNVMLADLKLFEQGREELARANSNSARGTTPQSFSVAFSRLQREATKARPLWL